MRISFLLLLFVLCSPFVSANDSFDKNNINVVENDNRQRYFNGVRRAENGRADVYSAAMHNSFADIKSNYEERGVHYYSDQLSSFGFQVIFDHEQEYLECVGDDKSFSDAIRDAQASAILVPGNPAGPLVAAGNAAFAGRDFRVAHSSTTSGLDPDLMVGAIENVLRTNESSKGRFCYRPTDTNVSYRTAGSATAVYCPQGTRSAVYQDPVSLQSCQLELDIDLKVGETRYVRQLQETGLPTIAQGFVGCYKDPISGIPTVEFPDDPDSCTESNRSTCLKSCDWADEVVCMPADMPRWGGGQCGGYGTVTFKDEVITVDASSQLSYNSETETLYQGSAVMACLVTGSGPSRSASWSVVSSECTPVTE